MDTSLELIGNLKMKHLIIIVGFVLTVCTVSFLPRTSAQLSDTTILEKDNSRETANGELLWKTIVPFYLEKFLLNPEAGKLANGAFQGLSTDCENDAMEWIHQLRNNSENLLHSESWALHLTDAWAKAPEGFLNGHTNALGDYDGCLAVRADKFSVNPIAKSFQGKYCLAMVYPKGKFSELTYYNPETGKKSAIIEEMKGFIGNDLSTPSLVPSFGTCFPSTCSIDDAQIFVENLFAFLMVEDKLELFMFDCITDENISFDTGDIVYSCVLGVVILICLLATLVDICSKKRDNKSKLQESLLAFSFKRNLLAWLSTKADHEDNIGLRCLSGIRFLTVAWIILAHTWEMPVLGYYPAWNKVNLNNIHKRWSTLLITNGDVALDTFFTITAITVSYNLLKSLDKYKNRILSVAISFLQGLLRLTPMYGLVIGFAATFWQHLGSGPYSGLINDASASCQQNWWTNLLYVNNFVYAKFGEMCLTDSWYFANEIQFLLLSPIIILSLWKWRSAGLIITILTIVGSVLTPTILTNDQEELPSTIPTRDIRQYFEDIYIKPWNRASPYLCGILCGYLIYITDKSIKLSKLTVLAGWLLSTAAALAIILGLFPYFDPEENIPKTEAALYAGFHRFGWGIIISWIVFACSKGYGGLINRFLAWKFFVPLGRLTVATYLVCFPVQLLLHLGFRQSLTHDIYSMVYFFFADLLCSLFIGFLIMLVIGMPCCQLETILFQTRKEYKVEDIELEMHPRQERFGIFYDKDVSISIEPQKKRKRAGDHAIEMQEPKNSHRHGIFYNKDVSSSMEPNKKR